MNIFKYFWNKLFPSKPKCEIAIGDYFIQVDGGAGKPILRQRVKLAKFDDLYSGYYPISKGDDYFIENVKSGLYKVIEQSSAKEKYGYFNN